MGRPIDWHSVARCIQIDPSKRSKEVWWNWYAIRINYASKDNRWRNCRLTETSRNLENTKKQKNRSRDELSIDQKLVSRIIESKNRRLKESCVVIISEKDIAKDQKQGMKGEQNSE